MDNFFNSFLLIEISNGDYKTSAARKITLPRLPCAIRDNNNNFRNPVHIWNASRKECITICQASSRPEVIFSETIAREHDVDIIVIVGSNCRKYLSFEIFRSAATIRYDAVSCTFCLRAIIAVDLVNQPFILAARIVRAIYIVAIHKSRYAQSSRSALFRALKMMKTRIPIG